MSQRHITQLGLAHLACAWTLARRQRAQLVVRARTHTRTMLLFAAPRPQQQDRNLNRAPSIDRASYI